MIEINLLPGAKKAKRGGGGKSLDFAALGAAISSKVKDKFLAAAVVSGVVAFAVIGVLFWLQRGREADLKEAEAKAVADSERFAVVLRDRMSAQARRDSALTQLSIIKAIDADRYIWPHFLEEVSRALPIYTWVRSLAISGTAQGVNPAAAVRTPPPDTGTRRRPRPDLVLPQDTVKVVMVGRTMNLEAFTRFMRSLEDSPFIEAVTMKKTEPLIESGKDVTQFTIEVTYTRPDTLMLRREPIVFTQR